MNRIILSLILSLSLPFTSICQNALQDSIKVQLKILKENPEDKLALRKLGLLYLNKADYDKAIHYGQQLFNIGYRTHDFYDAILYGHICLGQAYMMKGSPKAWGHLKQAQMNAESHKLDSALCSVYNGLGLYSLNIQKDYYEALSYYFKGIEAAKRSHNERLHSILLANISEVYFLKKDTTGLEYALECYERGHKTGDVYLMFAGASCSAYLYYLKNDCPIAMKYMQEAEFLMERNDFYDQANIYNLYGYILLQQDKADEALEFFGKALELKDQSQPSSVMNSYRGYAQALMIQKQYDQAITMLNKGINLSQSCPNMIWQSELIETLSACYEQKGNLFMALHYQKMFQKETDSLHNAEKERAVSELRVQYDYEHQKNIIKQHEVDLLQKEKKMLLLSVILICIFLIAVICIGLYRRKNKLYLAIVRQNQEAIHREQVLYDKIAQKEEELYFLKKQIKERQEEKTTDTSVRINKYNTSSLTDEKKAELFHRLETLLQEQKIYTDNLLTKEKVAELLDTNRTYLSQVINEQTGQTFTQLINGIRTREAIRLLSNPKNDTPLKALSANLGFNSMTTFYNQFQSATGMTPTQYKNKVKELHKDK